MKTNKYAIGLVLTGSILFTAFVFYFYQVFFTENVQVERGATTLVIQEDWNFTDLQDEVYERGIVNDMLSFSFVAKILDYQENIKPGVYMLEPDMTNLQFVRMLRAGNQTPVQLTFNTVRLKSDLAAKLADDVSADSVDFINALNSDSVVAAYGFEQENFMCMFIPNTYEVYYTASVYDIFDRMKQEYDNFWTDERRLKADSLGLSPNEVSILASIVQAETVKPDERPKIAGVYLNRLDRGIALQADPALVYAAGDFSIKRVLNKHKEIDSPYNLYKYRGLPPGPINLPEINSIDAVLNPEKHNYLYFCAKPDFSGYHAFATNLRQHNRNARAYQNALNRSNIYK